jgi:hypothetical protein
MDAPPSRPLTSRTPTERPSERALHMTAAGTLPARVHFHGMQTAITTRPADFPWRVAALASAAALTAANSAALTVSLRLASSLRARRTPRPRVFPALASGATALGALTLGALSVGALAIGALAIGALAIGRLRGGDWKVDSLRIHSLQVEQWTGPTRPALSSV